MRDLRVLDKWRAHDFDVRYGMELGSPARQFAGAFRIPVENVLILCVASAYRKSPRPNDNFNPAWDHVSASLPDRCPTWGEMCEIKDHFFKPKETVMQLHVPPEDHVNNMPYCLHLWRPALVEVPRPPAIMVGVKGLGNLMR